MVKMDEHLAKIKETQRQISKTTSWKRKRDLKNIWINFGANTEQRSNI